ncbi:hypothetical protein N9N67_07190 [Bacteriovoracaceae bacterium]|nr:hypothetical protein [Bacteriovoracaceae bacterium]
MKKLLSVVLSLNLVGSLFANLPDEIDHPTYKNKYQNQKNISDDLLTELQDIGREIEKTDSEISQTRLDLSQLKSTNEKLQIDINQARQSNAQLQQERGVRVQENASLRVEINELDQQIRTIDQDLDRIGRRLNKLDRQYKKDNRLYKQEERKLKDAKVVKRNLVASIKGLRTEIQKLKATNNALKTQNQSLKTQVEQNKNKIKTINSRIAEIDSVLPTMRQQKQGFEKQEKNIKAKIDQISKTIAPQEKKIATLKQTLTKTKNEKSAQEKAKTQKKNSIKSKQKQLATSDQEIAKLQEQLQTIDERVKSLQEATDKEKTALTEKTKKVEDLKAIVAENRPKVRELTKRIKEAQAAGDKATVEKLKKQRQPLMRRVRGSMMQIKKLEPQIVQHQKTIKENEAKIAQIKNSAPNLKQKIAKIKEQKKTLKTDIKALKSQIQAIDTKVAQLNTKIKATTAEIKTVETSIASSLQKKKQLQTKMAEVTKNKSVVQTQITKLTQEKKNKKTLVAKTKTLNQTHQTTITANKKKLTQNKTSVENKSRKVGVEVNKKDQLIRQIAQMERDQSIRYTNLTALFQKLEKVQRQQDRMFNDRKNLTQVLNDREIRLNNNMIRISQIDSDIASNSDFIFKSETAIKTNLSQIDQLNQHLANLRIYKRDKEQSEVKVNEDYQIEVAKTNDLKSKYDQRLNLYNSYLRKSAQMGTKQAGRLGVSKGDKDGESLALTKANSLATKTATQAAIYDSAYRGFIRGEIAGQDNGYDDGVKDQATYDQGYKVGYQTGLDLAVQTAMNEDFPTSFSKEFNKILTQTKTSKVIVSELMLNSSEDMFTASLVKSYEHIENISNAGPEGEDLSQVEVRNSQRIKSVSDSTISLNKEKLDYEMTEKIRLSNPAAIYTSVQNIKVILAQRKCGLVYKQVADFITECKENYNDKYRSNYKTAHENAFRADYKNTFNSTFSNVFKTKRVQKYQTHYQTSYDQVYVQYKNIGLKDIQNKGVKDGEINGYDENIKSERSKATSLGIQKASEHFVNNPVVRLCSTSNKSTLSFKNKLNKALPGSEFSLGLCLSNAGSVSASDKDVQIKIVSQSSDIKFTKNTFSIGELAAKKKKEFSDALVGTILPSATPGQKFNFDLKLIYPGSAVQASYSEAINISQIIKVNPEFTMDSINYKDSVSWRKRKRSRKGATIGVRFNIKGLYKGITGSYTIKPRIVQERNYAKFTKSTYTFPAVPQGQVVEWKMLYKFKKKANAAGKKLELIFDIYYGKDLLETINLPVTVK